MTASLAAERAADAPATPGTSGATFAPMPLAAHLPIAAAMHYQYDPAAVHMDGGRFATERTVRHLSGAQTGVGPRGPHAVSSRRPRLAGRAMSCWPASSPISARAQSARWRWADAASSTAIMDRPVRPSARSRDDSVRAEDTRRTRCGARATRGLRRERLRHGCGRRGSSGGTDRKSARKGKFALGYPRDDHGVGDRRARFRYNPAATSTACATRSRIDDYPVLGRAHREFHLTGFYTSTWSGSAR